LQRYLRSRLGRLRVLAGCRRRHRAVGPGEDPGLARWVEAGRRSRIPAPVRLGRRPIGERWSLVPSTAPGVPQDVWIAANVSLSELRGFSRDLDDLGTATSAPVTVFPRFLGRSGAQKGRLHRDRGRTHVAL